MLTRGGWGRALKLGICTLVSASGGLSLYRRSRRRGSLKILMYHKVDGCLDPLGLAITPDFFSRQLQELTRSYQVIPLAEAVSRLEQGALDRDYIVITFDDGYRDNYSVAYPILQRFAAPATIFLTGEAVESGSFGWHRFDSSLMQSARREVDLTDFGVGRHSLAAPRDRQTALVELHRALKRVPEATRQAAVTRVLELHGDPGAGERIMLSWEEARQMQQSGLVTIGAHTLSHPILTRVPRERAWEEIRGGKLLIERRTGRPVEFFAYPNGGPEDFDPEIREMVRQCGYRAACSTIPAGRSAVFDPFALPRTDVTPGICRGLRGFSRDLFAVKISGMLDGILFRW